MSSQRDARDGRDDLLETIGNASSGDEEIDAVQTGLIMGNVRVRFFGSQVLPQEP